MHAIRAAHAFDGERFLPGGATVLVEDERIVGVEGPHHEPPEGCPLATYDGTLLPGLVDAHVHLIADASLMNLPRVPTYPPEQVDAIIADSLAAEAAAGVTTVRDLGDVGYRTLAFRDRAEPGVPRIVAAGPPLTEPEGHCHYLGGVVDGPAAVRAAIGERVERGVDVVKVMASGGMATDGSDVNGVQFGPDDLRLLVDCAHDAGLRVLAHTHSLRGIRHAVAAGVDGLEHFTSLTDEGIRHARRGARRGRGRRCRRRPDAGLERRSESAARAAASEPPGDLRAARAGPRQLSDGAPSSSWACAGTGSAWSAAPMPASRRSCSTAPRGGPWST